MFSRNDANNTSSTTPARPGGAQLGLGLQREGRLGAGEMTVRSPECRDAVVPASGVDELLATCRLILGDPLIGR
jgi:hypothetical protein